MMLSDSEDVESNLVRMLDLLDKVAQALRCAERAAGVIVRRREAINANLHLCLPLSVLCAGGHHQLPVACVPMVRHFLSI
jgi:hypothetical protein